MKLKMRKRINNRSIDSLKFGLNSYYTNQHPNTIYKNIKNINIDFN